MSKSIIFIILLVLLPLSLIVANDFITEIDSQGNKVLVEYIGYDSDVVIPDDITIIGEWAFYDGYFIESIVIPNSVTTIEMGAFYECSSVESVTIPKSVLTFGLIEMKIS